jgi:hypothetical protein
MADRIEVDAEHHQESVGLRAAIFVIEDQRVGPQLLLDPDRFVVAWK